MMGKGNARLIVILSSI